jgi:hypothetical protein
MIVQLGTRRYHEERAGKKPNRKDHGKTEEIRHYLSTNRFKTHVTRITTTTHAYTCDRSLSYIHIFIYIDKEENILIE